MIQKKVPFSLVEILDILDKANVGILITNEEGIIVWGNCHFEKITLLKIDDWIGKECESMYWEGYISVVGLVSLRAVVMRDRKSVHRIVDYKTKDDVIVTATPIYDSENNIRWVIYILTDWDELTDLKKQLQEAFEQTEANRRRLQEATMGGLEQYGIIARDKVMRDVYATALRISHVDATLMILGETGVGKDIMAKFIHKSGPRKEANFVHVNCSAIPENLFESELFGYEPGSFTGADRQGKLGLIEMAHQGTLFLDEVAELPLVMQAKLLTVLQEKEFVRIGGTKPRPVDVRIIAATNRDLAALVKEKLFREDLYYRLNVLEIMIPSLRERRYDIPAFVSSFTEMFNKKYNQNKKFSLEVMNVFMEYDWPGNVRELHHLIERLVIMCPDEMVKMEHLPKEFRGSSMLITEALRLAGDGVSLKNIVEQVEAEVIRDIIAKTNNLNEAAKQLGLDMSTLTRKKQKYNIYSRKMAT